MTSRETAETAREKPLHAAVACGGTGGHFYPTLAIADELAAKGVRVTLFVAGHHADEQIRTATERGFKAVQAPAMRLPRLRPDGALFPFRFLAAVRACRKLLAEADPDGILGMGSFAAVPLCLAGVRMKLPLVLHEGNSRMGKANRLLSRWAAAAAVSLPLEPGAACRCPTVETGMPLRTSLLDAARDGADTPAFLTDIGLDPNTPVVLVFGGSQGARAVNDLVTDALPRVPSAGTRLQVIHFTGTDENRPIEDAYARAGIRAHVRRGDPRIERSYLAASLVICRGGASSACELALFGKPAILIPLPTAADDHQTVNARLLAARGAAIHLPQATADAAALERLVAELLESPERREALGTKIAGLAAHDAAARVADLVIRTVRDREAQPKNRR